MIRSFAANWMGGVDQGALYSLLVGDAVEVVGFVAAASDAGADSVITEATWGVGCTFRPSSRGLPVFCLVRHEVC